MLVLERALSRKFPEWCKVIGARSLQHRDKTVRERRNLIREEVLRTVSLLKSQNQYASVLRVVSNMKIESSPAVVHRMLREITTCLIPSKFFRLLRLKSCNFVFSVQTEINHCDL